jgi:hypothetical protein
MGGLLLQGLRLLPQLVDLPRGLFQGIFLHQHSLRQDIEGVGIAAQPLDQQLLCFGILFGQLGLLDTTDQVVQHRFFLGSHLVSNAHSV